MDKTDYIAIKNQLSFDKPLWVTFAVMAFDLGMLALILAMATSGNTLLYIASQLLLVIFIFHNFALLHEAGHGNISQKRWINTLVGHYASIFCFMPYYSWQHIHQGHHVWLGNVDRDPTMKAWKRARANGGVPKFAEVTWRWWIPVPAVIQHFAMWLYPIKIWREGTRGRPVWRSACSVAFLIVSYAALIKLFPEWMTFKNFGPGIILYLIYTEAENLPHHAQVPTFSSGGKREKLNLWEQHISTRSCDMPSPFSEFLTLNFNLHTEHHYFPSMPWYRLKKVRDLIKPKLGEHYTEVEGFKWNLKNRRTQTANDIVLTIVPHPLLENN